MLNRKNLIYLLLGLNIILLATLIFHKTPSTVEAQTCVPIFNVPYEVRGPFQSKNNGGAGADKQVFCNNGDLRVACAAGYYAGNDGKDKGVRAPHYVGINGCQSDSNGEEDDRSEVVAYCLGR